MASLYIPSLLDRQKRKYWGQICAAREELARFEDGLDDLVGVSTAGIVRLHLHPSLALRLKLNPVPDVPPEGQEAYAEALRLVGQETQFTRHLHSPVCCYRERSSPPYVLWCYGVSWDDIECQRNEEGMVTLDYAMRLLDVLLHRKPQEVKAHHIAPEELDGWETTFRHNRRRLVRFLRRAAKLEEDLMWGVF